MVRHTQSRNYLFQAVHRPHSIIDSNLRNLVDGNEHDRIRSKCKDCMGSERCPSRACARNAGIADMRARPRQEQVRGLSLQGHPRYLCKALKATPPTYTPSCPTDNLDPFDIDLSSHIRAWWLACDARNLVSCRTERAFIRAMRRAELCRSDSAQAARACVCPRGRGQQGENSVRGSFFSEHRFFF